MAYMKYSFTKEAEIITDLGFDGSLVDMCDGIVKLIEEILLNYADKHPTEPKEYVADIVRRKIIHDMQIIIDKNYNMDSLFEQMVLESNEESDRNIKK